MQRQETNPTRQQGRTPQHHDKAAGPDATAPRGSTAPRGTAQGSRAPRERGPHSNTAQAGDER